MRLQQNDFLNRVDYSPVFLKILLKLVVEYFFLFWYNFLVLVVFCNVIVAKNEDFAISEASQYKG